MDEEIHRSPFAADRVEHRIHRGDVLDIAGQQQLGADAVGQRLDALSEGFALIGERQFRAVLGQSLGDAPGDGVIIGDAHDEAPLAGHQALHGILPSTKVPRNAKRLSRCGAAG